MQLDLSADHLVWDQAEAVTLEVSGRLGPVARASLEWAKGRAVRGRERSPSGGAYAGYERNWHLPRRPLEAAGIDAVKPGDVIEEADGPTAGRRWTVLTADYDRLQQRWACGCVDLVLAHDLRDAVTIEEATISYDSAGAAVKTFPPAGGGVLAEGLPARVQPVSSAIDDERGLRYSKDPYEVTIGRQLPALDPAEDRVRWADFRTGLTWLLDIVEVRQPERIDQLPVLLCERRG